MSQLITKLCTFFHGIKVGQDIFGNTYYKSRNNNSKVSLKKERRWVIYKKHAEPSCIPPLWHAWLHYTIQETPPSNQDTKLYKWQQPHLPNLTGTPYAYRPKGHTLRGGVRDKSTGDYEPWNPNTMK